MKRNGFSVILILVGILILSLGGWYFFTKYKTQTSGNTSPSVPTGTPTITSGLKEYITKGYASKIDYPKLTFSYPSDWAVSEDASLSTSRDIITVTKDNHSVIIEQALIPGAGICQFSDSPKLNAPSIDLTTIKYEEITSSFGQLRYFLHPSSEFAAEKDKTTTVYNFCVKLEGNVYGFPSLGYVSIKTPMNRNEAVFQQALDIVKTIRSL